MVFRWTEQQHWGAVYWQPTWLFSIKVLKVQIVASSCKNIQSFNWETVYITCTRDYFLHYFQLSGKVCFFQNLKKYLRGKRGKSRFENVSKTLNQMKMSKTVNAVCLPPSCGLFRRLNLSVSELLNPHTSSRHNTVFKTRYRSYQVFFFSLQQRCIKVTLI